jgi:CheY-like chemotaxis protein
MNNILLIEDNHDVRKNIADCLSAEGYAILEANGGFSAITYLEKYLPDLVICGIIMPGMNGFDVYKIMFSYLRINKIPFIQFTAKSGIDKHYLKIINVKNFTFPAGNERNLISFITTYFSKSAIKTESMKRGDDNCCLL